MSETGGNGVWADSDYVPGVVSERGGHGILDGLEELVDVGHGGSGVQVTARMDYHRVF